MVNVKAYNFTDVDAVTDRFGCSEATAQKALEMAFECQQESFWETYDSEEMAYFFPGNRNAQVYSAGRSGGWLVVEGLPDVEDWDAVMLGRWRRFEIAVNANVKYLTSDEQVLELIEINEWAMDKDALDTMLREVSA